MKIFIYLLITAAAALLIYNISHVDFSNPFEGDSMVAAICILASACTILLLSILLVAKKIEKKR